MAKELSTMAKYRSGFNILWRKVPKMMTRMKVKRPGGYDPFNHHGGQMPGWPFEMKLTNDRVEKIVFAVLRLRGDKRVTFSQLRTIRKCLSYFWELKGKKTKEVDNWPCVANLLETVSPGAIRPNTHTTSKAKRIPTPQQLKHAILKGWKRSRKNEWPLPKWCSHYRGS